MKRHLPSGSGSPFARPVEPIDAGAAVARVDRASHSAGAGERRRDPRLANDLVAERLLVAGAVSVRRERELGLRHVGAVVRDEQRFGDESLAGRVGRPAEELTVEGHGRGPACVERGCRHDAESDHRLRKLEVRHPRRVARPAAVDDEHDDAPIRALTDRRPWMASVQVVAAEVFERVEDRLAPAHDHRPAAERLRDVSPLRAQDQANGDQLARGSLDRQPLPLGSFRREHGASGRNRRAAASVLRDEADQVRVRRRGGKRRENRFGHAVVGRCRRPVRRCVERRAVRPRRPVEQVHCPPRARPCQVPSIATRSTRKLPAVSTPTIDRFGCGVVLSTPSWIRPLLGIPSAQVKRSPLTLPSSRSARPAAASTSLAPARRPPRSTGRAGACRGRRPAWRGHDVQAHRSEARELEPLLVGDARHERLDRARGRRRENACKQARNDGSQ